MEKILRLGPAILLIIGGATQAAPPVNTRSLSPPPVQTMVTQPSPPIPVPAPSPQTNPHGASPRNNPGFWVTNNDYPTIALRNGLSGTVAFRIAVSASGVPTRCDITASSGTPALDETTCSLLMRRSRFYPATDAQGNPIEGSWNSRMRWEIPKSEIKDISPGSLTRSFTIEPDGTASNCAEFVDGKPVVPPTQRYPCDGVTKFKPNIDANGIPVRKRITVTQSIVVSDAP